LRSRARAWDDFFVSRALHGSSVVVATLIGVGLGGGGRARAEQKADRGAVALADRGLDADADASATVTSRVDASAGAPSWPWPELGWPSSTRSALTRGATEVFAAARGRGGQLGEVAPGIRLQVTDVVDSGGRCGAWLQIAPRGWVCAADVTPSTGAPLPTERTRAVGRSLIGAYADVRAGGADAFADEAAVRAAAPRDRLSPEDFVVLRASVDIDGRAYFRTDLGLVAAERVTRREASSFAGVDPARHPGPELALRLGLAARRHPAARRARPTRARRRRGRDAGQPGHHPDPRPARRLRAGRGGPVARRARRPHRRDQPAAGRPAARREVARRRPRSAGAGGLRRHDAGVCHPGLDGGQALHHADRGVPHRRQGHQAPHAQRRDVAGRRGTSPTSRS
jgi:hypothetical protein